MAVKTFRSCAHWGAFDVDVSDGRAVAARPFALDPAPSPLLASLLPSVYSPTRIRAPMVREGYLRRAGTAGRGREGFVEVSWPRAIELAAQALARTRERHGNQAIFGGSYGWSSAGRVGHARTLLHRFLNCIGGFVDQQQTYSLAAAGVLLPHVVGGIEAAGGPVTEWRSIIANTRLMVMLGGAALRNGRVTAGGAGGHGYELYLRQAKAAGVRFVVVSPSRDDAPSMLDAEFIPIRPNTDIALLLGVAHSLVCGDLHNREFLVRYTVGFERFEAYLKGVSDQVPKSAEWASALTGVPAERIRRLASELVAERSMLTASWSLQRAERGEQVYWALIALAAMVGHIGLPGGGFGFGYGSINGMGSGFPPTRGPSMDTGRNPVDIAIPVARITDLLLGTKGMRYNGRTLQFPEIRLVYWAGGNPFHHHQDLNRLLTAWQRPETIIVNEIWWTSTARHADIVFPATTSLERPDVSSSPRDRFLFPMEKAIDPVGGARNDYDIFSELASTLGVGKAFTEGRDMDAWARHLYEGARARAEARRVELPSYEAFLKQGYAEYPASESPFVLYEDFRRDPAAYPLRTPSGKIEIFSETLAGFGDDDCAGYPAWRSPREWLGAPLAARFPLHLLSTQPAMRLHGQLDAGPASQATKINLREPIQIHPEDAAARGIRDGDIVRVFNDRGACLAGAAVSSRILKGVVYLSTGAWYDPLVPGEAGTLEKHGNPNVLSHDLGTSSLSQGPAPQSALVQIELHHGPVPALKCFEAPPCMEEMT